MLKKIAVQQLRMGMHLHKLDGAWIDHPFWKARFVIDSAADLKRLHECGVAECWIDTRLGLDVATVHEPAPVPAPVPASASAPSPTGPLPAAAPGANPAPASHHAEHEVQHAAAVCQRGREAVLAMFNEARMGRTVDAEPVACRWWRRSRARSCATPTRWSAWRA